MSNSWTENADYKTMNVYTETVGYNFDSSFAWTKMWPKVYHTVKCEDHTMRYKDMHWNYLKMTSAAAWSGVDMSFWNKTIISDSINNAT